MFRADIVNQGSITANTAFTLNVQSLDETDAAVIPTTLEWTLVCKDSGVLLQDWASLTPTLTYDVYGALLKAEVDVAVSALFHTMQTNQSEERKSLVVSANRNLADERRTENLYTIVRTGARS